MDICSNLQVLSQVEYSRLDRCLPLGQETLMKGEWLLHEEISYTVETDL
jgi:hypothetical protein